MATHHDLTASDGRSLGVAEWGDPAGAPVMLLHGTPGSRFNRPGDEQRVRDLGLRLVTYDRPGYGASDRHPGRRVVDCARDIEVIADRLGLDRFHLTGTSGGGPHALAAAARLGDRLVRVRCNVGVAPYHAGMDPENVKEFGWAEAGEETLHPALAAEADRMLERLRDDPADVLGPDWELPETDRAVMARPEVQRVYVETFTEAFRTGVWGWVDDDLAFVRPWGFELTEITVPVEVSYGAHDVMVPAGHGAWLAAHVPGASVSVEEAGGHLKDHEAILQGLVELASR